MCDPEVFPLELQNHFLHVSHLTTEAGEWMPQYLLNGCAYEDESNVVNTLNLLAEAHRNIQRQLKTYLHACGGNSVRASG